MGIAKERVTRGQMSRSRWESCHHMRPAMVALPRWRVTAFFSKTEERTSFQVRMKRTRICSPYGTE